MMNVYINALGEALPAEQRAAGAPLTRTGFIPLPRAAPALLPGVHMLLLKSGSVNHRSCTQSLLLSPQRKVTQRKTPEAAGIKGKGRQTQGPLNLTQRASDS